ncbi:MAG: NAD-dependent epimerase/dehydratase family protein [Elusimicrobia bacterium]|nr:NAD-dependent epimerase/dehydratase family protein [Elusimicrobiota bacterium]
MSAKRKTAVVAGGAGFIGAHLCRRLIAEGMRVVCLDSLVTSGLQALRGLRRDPRFDFLRFDINRPFKLPGKFGYFFHLACPASPKAYMRLPLLTLRTGSLGTMNCLEAASAAGARFILASTSEVYGDPLRHPQREDYFGNVDPVGPRSCYDEAKRFSEAAVAAYRGAGRAEGCIARIFNTYGEGMLVSDGRVVSNMICAAVSGRPLPVNGDGSQTRSFCYIADMVEGILRLALRGVPGPVNLGNPQEVSILKLAGMINRITGNNAGLRFLKASAGDPRKRKPDISLAVKLLGWRPLVTLEEGLENTCGWFKDIQGRGNGAHRT